MNTSDNTIKKTQILELISQNPYKIGHWVGFRNLTELHNQWLKLFLFGTKDQTLQGHRGSYKTTVLSLFLALTIVIYPNLKTLFFRKTGGDVTEVIRQVKRILDSGCMREIVRILYGKELKILKATENEIHTNLCTSIGGSSQLVGLGIGTSITGKHADIVVTDDIVNINDRTSRAERERTKLAYQELINVKNRGGRFINTGTPWHEDDAFKLMPNPIKFDCYSTGLMSQDEIRELKASMLPSLFAANYELRNIASEDVIFSDPVTGADPALVEQSNYVHIDAAYNGTDSTAYTICKKIDGKYYVFGKLWRKHVDDCLSDIVTYQKAFKAGKIYNETNGDKGYLSRDLRKLGERPVPYSESTNKFLKITSYLRSEWKNVIFVAGTDEEYIKQITDYNENAEHDDAPDSLASIIRILWGKRTTNSNKSAIEFLR